LIDPVLLLRSLDTMADVALIYDRHMRMVYVNRSGAMLLGISRELAVGKSNEQVFGPTAQLFDAFLEQAFRTKEKVVAKQTLPGGPDLETIFTPILGDNGNPQFVIGISRAYSMISEITLPSEPEGGSTADRNESVGARSTTSTCEE
jgi:PAS domain S-box-containing protein